MRAKNIFFVGVCGVIVLCVLGYQKGLAAAKEEGKTARIGVVSLRELFQNCKKNADYRTKVEKEQEEALAELNQLSAEIEASKAALKTRKVGSEDYWQLQRELLLKQSGFNAKKEFFQQRLMQKDRQWTEELFREILKYAGEAAKQKGLDIVLARDELDLPSDASSTELMLAIRTHKLLYAAEELDITKDVLVLMDAGFN